MSKNEVKSPTNLPEHKEHKTLIIIVRFKLNMLQYEAKLGRRLYK